MDIAYIKQKLKIRKHKNIIKVKYNELKAYDKQILQQLVSLKESVLIDLDPKLNFDLDELENQIKIAIRRIDNLLDDTEQNNFAMLKTHADFVNHEQERVKNKWFDLQDKISKVLSSVKE